MAGARRATGSHGTGDTRAGARPTPRIAPARRVALRLLGEQRRRAGRMRDLLRESSAMDALDERGRSLVTRLTLGVVATRGTLDACIDAHARGLPPGA